MMFLSLLPEAQRWGDGVLKMKPRLGKGGVTEAPTREGRQTLGRGVSRSHLPCAQSQREVGRAEGQH